MIKTILILVILSLISLVCPMVSNSNKTLSQATYSLSNRYSNSYVNDVFSDNILLTIAYMGGRVKKGEKISWDTIKTPSVNKLILNPGQTFAFHDTALQKYKNKIATTTNAHFISSEGFKSDGRLVGDGVCHLASFMYVVSKKAGLIVEAPIRHDFAKIADVPKQDGVSVFYSQKNPYTSALQNLYITNNRKKPIAFVFTHKDKDLNIKVEQFN
ncbi:hypothetical protein A3C23_02215 [Candidatus Roizmanbacteria bacterium RIFCSPHIGHO2_02_FULL_37_13b]|uniref:Uncharacterized protein n=1 Tax=Candidatus Roizmanbacteria bacterium RIFCSPLOWO2_02_FULL_36_11 TaxID=1802071 RepID=A0A1F7JGM2_9BACT|nr:MAG: hypothetical protein A3C23_02215 [Candidatus Roizmanbacteria bacterium RIFCSPHIGHO2_02_FULL_37_13b]OGK54758.1 MAG: hypothetical protein A3H78_05715 [Candidatus Roizmanbacteria bacterium RIFCSPLOWO2_02_FULL_36_11]